MKKIRIKWFNVGVAFMLLICCLIIGSTLIRLVTSLASLTYEGVLLNIMSSIVADVCFDYLQEEANK